MWSCCFGAGGVRPSGCEWMHLLRRSHDQVHFQFTVYKKCRVSFHQRVALQKCRPRLLGSRVVRARWRQRLVVRCSIDAEASTCVKLVIGGSNTRSLVARKNSSKCFENLLEWTYNHVLCSLYFFAHRIFCTICTCIGHWLACLMRYNTSYK